MSTTIRPTAGSPSAQRAPLGPWGSVVVSAATLATVGGTFGSIVMSGLFNANGIGGSGGFWPWEYLSLRDMVEELVLAAVMVYAYRSLPATQRALRGKGGVLKVAAVFGTLALFAMRVLYGVGARLPSPGLLARSWVLLVGCIAYPIVWTVARRAPDAEPHTSTNRLTDREFFNTSVGLFLVVGSVYFMHWVIYDWRAGLLNFFAVFVIPTAALVLAVSARHVMAGVSRALGEEPPAWLLTIAAVVIWWAAVIHYLVFAHPPRR